jgi:hypothetical protein
MWIRLPIDLLSPPDEDRVLDRVGELIAMLDPVPRSVEANAIAVFRASRVSRAGVVPRICTDRTGRSLPEEESCASHEAG